MVLLFQQTLNNTFYNALPNDLKNVIKITKKFTDNTGNCNRNSAEAISASYKKIWLLSEYEPLNYFYSHCDNTIKTEVAFLRSCTKDDRQSFVTYGYYGGPANSNGIANANYDSYIGFNPCFTI